MKNREQKGQNATAGFVLNKYTKIKDVLELKWLPTEERIELSKMIFLFKALHDQIPKHLQSQQKRTNLRVIRNDSNGNLIDAPKYLLDNVCKGLMIFQLKYDLMLP